jgi:hypothetical protein
VIEALATIVFDTEAPIDTPLWSNAIDAGGPLTSVQALGATTVGPDFTVSWSGADDAGGSGIGTYDVFVATDGGAFAPWLTGTTETAATFTGEIGRTYAFYSVATDNVGHREAEPVVADTTTRVVEIQENQAPVLTAIGNRTVAEGEELVFVVSATDADVPAQALTFSATGLPEGATFDPAMREFRWTPTEAQGPGLFEAITFSVSDGEDADSETIRITVTEANAAPVAQLTGPTSEVRGQPLAFTGAFSDADPLDTHEVAVNWGDGSSTPFHPATDPEALDLSHVYTAVGTYEARGGSATTRGPWTRRAAW